MDPALQNPNVSLLTDAYVEKLTTDDFGRRISKVVVRRQGQREELSADIVVISCGAINSAALLLRSANDKHPRGLANNSDMVGRHYMGRVNSVLMALSKCPNPTIFQKSLSVNDFYFGTTGWNYPLGHISFVGKLDGETLRGGAPAIAPGWTLDLMAKHSLDFWLTSEDLPDPNNRVTIDSEAGIVLSYSPNNQEGHKRLIVKLKELMQQQSRCSVHGDNCHEGLFASSGGHRPFRQRSENQRARCKLQSPRLGQSLRCRWQLFRIQRRCQSGTHDHGQCAACWASSYRKSELRCDEP